MFHCVINTRQARVQVSGPFKKIVLGIFHNIFLNFALLKFQSAEKYLNKLVGKNSKFESISTE